MFTGTFYTVCMDCHQFWLAFAGDLFANTLPIVPSRVTPTGLFLLERSIESDRRWYLLPWQLRIFLVIRNRNWNVLNSRNRIVLLLNRKEGLFKRLWRNLWDPAPGAWGLFLLRLPWDDGFPGLYLCLHRRAHHWLALLGWNVRSRNSHCGQGNRSL